MPVQPQMMVQPNPADKRRQALAAAMMKQGISSRPMRHPLEALGQMAQAYVGKEMAAGADEDYAQRQQKARENLASSMSVHQQAQDIGMPDPRGQMMEQMMLNPDTSGIATQMQLKELAGADAPKPPTGYQRAPGGGVEQIPGWINTARYKPVTTTDAEGNQITNLYDVGQLSAAGQPLPGATPVDPSGAPSAAPSGLIELGVKQEKTLSPEAAAKTAMMQQGMKDVQSAEKLLFNRDGTINRQNAANAWLNTPGTDGRLVYSYYFNAINAKLRAESGAAVPEEEVSRGIKTFMPNAFDNDKTGQEKIRRLHEFLGSTLINMEGSGRYVPKDAGLRGWMTKTESENAGMADLPKPITRADFDKLTKGTEYIDPGDGLRHVK